MFFFYVGNTKRIGKFDGLEPRRCEDIRGIVAPEIGPESFRSLEKRDTRFVLILPVSLLCKTDLKSCSLR